MPVGQDSMLTGAKELWMICGAFLTFLGTAGFGAGMCREQRIRIRLLQELEQFLQLAAGEISYGAGSLPEVFLYAAEKVGGITGTFLQKTGERLSDRKGECLEHVWMEELSLYLEDSPLKKEERAVLLSLPGEMEFPDKERQRQALERAGRQLDSIRQQLAGKQEVFEKTTMTLCLSAGAAAVILFW